MSNIPVFYVDQTMHLLTGDELRLLMFMAHKIIGEQIPFEGEQSYAATVDDLKKGTGLSGPEVNDAITVLSRYRLITPTGFPTNEGVIDWALCPLDEVDLAGLAARKKADKK